MKQYFFHFLLTIIILFGFYFRFTGISASHSLWADEAEIASDARDLALNNANFFEVVNRSGTSYQPANMLLNATSIKLFGVNELPLRFPYILVGTLGIFLTFLIGKKLSSNWGGVLSAFLYSFTQLNLANHTQAKPYTIIQVLFLAEIYFLINLQKKENLKTHLAIILLNVLAVLFHTLGILIWIPYILYFIFNKKFLQNKKIIFGIFIILIVIGFLFKDIFAVFFKYNLIIKNDFLYFKQLFLKQYWLIFISFLTGIYFVYKKNKTIALGVFLYFLIEIYLVFFKQYVHNIRYLVPLFGLMFVFYGICWSQIGEKLFKKNVIGVFIGLVLLLIFQNNKLVFMPQTYYTPNNDFYGDVQIADYKTFYTKLAEKFPQYKKIIIFNDWLDPQRFYLQKNPNVYFMKGAKNGEIHIKDKNKKIYADLEIFLKEKNKYKAGILIVEDWESIMPESIKQYAKQNMKLEINVDKMNLPSADAWPLKAYSWGM